VPLVTRVRHRDCARLRKLLQPEGLDSWPKTTGGKGLHLMVPIGRDISHDAARLYCNRLAQRLEATAPARYTTSSAPAKRNKRIYIDYLRKRTRHDGDRRLFPARSGGLPGRRAGDMGAGGAWHPPGCIHDRAATPSGAAAQGSVREESTGRLNCFQKVGPLARVSLPGPGKLLCAAEVGR
jgi:hypothetical protein